MNRKLVKFGVLGLILASLQLLDVAVRAERLPISIYTSADGLGSSFVNYLMRDSRGFMWFCTRDGLSRFDGARFVTYGVGDSNSSPGIETIYEARDGSYWISTTNGTFHFNPDKVSESDTPGLAAEFVMPSRGQFFEDSKGNFWSNVHGFSRYAPQDGKHRFEKVDLKLPAQPGSGFHISDFAETVDGSVWLNTSWGLVRLLGDGRTVHYPVEYGGRYGNPSMLADKTGRIWLAATDRILVFKPESSASFTGAEGLIIKSFEAGAPIELEPGKSVPMPEADGEIVKLVSNDLNRFVEYSYAKRVFQTSDGDVWITAEDYLLHFSNGIYRVYTGAEGLPNVMSRMSEDKAGNLWIAGQAGLARLDRGGLVTFGKPDGAKSDRFFAISEDPDGTVYFAGRDFYLSRFVGGRLETIRPAVDANSNYLWTSRFAMRASDGDWWILTNRKLYRFASDPEFTALDGRQPTKVYTKENGLPGDAMFQIFEDPRGDIWVSTRTDDSPAESGIARLRKGEGTFHSFGEPDGLPSGKTFSAAVADRSGNIWFSFYTGGLARFDGTRFTMFDEATEGLPINTLPDLLVDRKGRLWIASATAGLIRVDDPAAEKPKFVPITAAHGLSSNNVRTLTEDEFGRIYIGSVRGLDRLSPDTGFIKHYSVSDGLAADFVVDSHADKNGNLWFATNNGISRLVPRPEEKIAPPQIYLGGLRIAGEDRRISRLGTVEINQGELSASQNNLQIDFFGLDFRAGEALRYQYKLEGADADWSPPADLHTVTFANLQPETYRFLVRAVNSEGAVSENPAVVSFTILPPIYSRWWFIALCALFVFGSVIAIDRYRAAQHRKLAQARLERLIELEQVRSRIATDLHDDIGASLTQIAILSEVARQKTMTTATNGSDTEPLSMIYNVSNELVGTMSDIVWAINPQKDQLHDLTLRMRRFASDVLTAREIDFEFTAPEDIEDFALNSNLRREVFLIFKEAINNIIKHSQATAVDVEFEIGDKELNLTVKDNGRGFDIEKRALDSSANLFAGYKGGNGLSSMQRRASEAGGELEILSTARIGTTVRLRMPLAIRSDSDMNALSG